MPRKVVADVPPPSNNRICCFCGLGDDNELYYGKFHEYNGIVTHYYCLLLSSNMQQKGRDDEGILGFLPEDINKELKRGKRLACCYCKKTGATLGCCNTKCKKIFHFPCGLKSGSLHQFFGEFRSYCKNHRPKQKIDDRVSEEVKKRDDMICYICYDDVSPIDMYGTLWAPCCKKNAWFHRTCVQQLAMSAGYFFKCPLCNNKAEFQRAMLDHGIFIPSQDASWELVPNAFEELLYRHNRCDADDCLCPKGREHTSSNAKWELTLCRTCGSQGIHMACGNLKWVKPIWECTECTSILNKTLASDSESSSVQQVSRQRRRLRDDENSNDDESSDSDISVGTETMEPSTSNSTPLKTRADESPESPPALRITRRSVIPIPKSPVNTKISIPKAVTKNEDLPPEPKRPRYSDHVVERNRRESIDSDDDIVVISGPSRSVNSPSNGSKSPLHRHTNNSWSEKTNSPFEYASPKKESEEPKKCEKTAYVSLDKFEMQQPTPTCRIPTDSEKKVVEIDLSESEYTIPEVRPNSIINATPAVISVANPPEFNFMITNVTSLAPEAFENVEEQKIEVKQDLTNIPSRTTIFNESNGGLTPQTPIVLDDEPLPVAPSNHVPENNNLHFSSTEIHDQIKIIRFDSPTDASGKPTNTVLYGITIPGTNQTVPLIFAPADNTNYNSTFEITEASDFNSRNENQPNMPGNNSSIFSPTNFIATLNGAKPLENYQIPSTAPIRSGEAPNASKSKASSLSLSVPLKAIVNERFPTSRSRRKSNDNSSNKTVVVSNQSSLDQAFGTSFATKNRVVQVQPIAPLNRIVQAQPITPINPVGSVQSIAPKKPVLQAQPIAPKKPALQVQPIAPKKPVLQAQPIAPKKPALQAQPIVPKKPALQTQTIAPKKPVLQPQTIAPKKPVLHTQPTATISPAVQVQPIIPNGSLKKVAGAPILPKTPLHHPNTPISNFGSSTTLKQPVSNAQTNKNSSNNIDAATISKMFALLPPATTRANSPLPNGFISSTNSRNMLNLNKPTTTNLNCILPDGNTTWLHSSGSIIKINSDTAKTGVTPANLSTSTQMQIQNSADNKQQISEPQLFQLIRTDSNNASSDDCDGDAGSGPAVQPASVNTSTNTKPRHDTARHSQHGEPLEVGKENTHDRRTSVAECDADTVDSAERSTSSDRSDACNRAGLIYKSINLRDLKFSVCGSNIVKMALYDTYTVNIKLDSLNPCKNSKYSSTRRAIKSSLGRDAQARNIERDDSNDASDTLDSRTSGISSNNNGLYQTESTSQDNVATADAVSHITDLPNIDVASRGQDELKENLDPIPPSTNFSQNATTAVDRKNKFRVRSGVDHSMRSLNEKEGQQMISEKNETPKKVTPHESQSLENHSKVLYNGWKDSACYEESNVQNVLSDRSAETVTKNVLPRSFVSDNNTADSDLVYASKRKRISANDENLGEMQNFVKTMTTKKPNDCNNGNINHLVKDVRISERKSKSSDDVSQLRKIHVNSTINKRQKEESNESLSCKVSIDLARIRSVLAAKLNSRDEIVDNMVVQQHEASTANDIDYGDFSDSESDATLYKFRSFDNLTCDLDEDITAGLRKSKSLENLCNSLSRSCVDNMAENRVHGYKRIRRSFEEHDCVR